MGFNSGFKGLKTSKWYLCTCKNPKTRQNCHSYFAWKLVNFFCTTHISSDFSVNPWI